jgi:hypothetical protein
MPSDNHESSAEPLFGQPSDADRRACAAELIPVVRRLMQQGLPTNAILAALCDATVVTVDHHCRQQRG